MQQSQLDDFKQFYNEFKTGKRKPLITEMPLLKVGNLTFSPVTKVSKERVSEDYTLLGSVGSVNVYIVSTGSIVFGVIDDAGNLNTMGSILCKSKKLAPIFSPTGIDKTFKQVDFVSVSDTAAKKGYTKLVYNFVASQIDLVSDHEQYDGARGLWKSLARESDTNIYVWDINERAYVRDSSSGSILKYNGKNIDDEYIWGDSIQHHQRLLVATIKDL